jgi:hypothetical protein
MKKILTLAVAITGFTFGAQAQTIADLEVTLVSPLAEDSETPFNIPCKDSFDYEFIIVNIGPGTIGAGDTVLYFSTLSPEGQINYTAHNSMAVPMGDTVIHVKTKLAKASIQRLWAEDGQSVSYPPFANGNYIFPILTRGYLTDTTVIKTSAHGEAATLAKIDCTTGINGLAKNNSTLKVFPNPANNQISFTNDFNTATTASVRITDIAGRVVKSMDLGKQNAGAKTYNVDIADLNSGMYYIELVTEATRSISKFIKN